MTTPTSPDARHEALAAYSLGTLPEEERAVVEAWLAESPDARAELAALRQALHVLAIATPQIDPPPSLRARVLAVASAPAGQAPAVHTAEPIEVRRRPAFAWAPWLVAATAVLAALGLGVHASQLRARVAILEAHLVESSSRLTRAEAETRNSQTLLARARLEADVLRAPDLTEVSLLGQGPAADARARAFWSRTEGIVLTTTRLPSLAPGRTYQLWLLNDGAPTSAGVFAPDATGAATAVFETSASVPAPKGMAVSIEPQGGSPGPTGEIVLAGTRATGFAR
jgi:anti-sigma-K factor RskA